MGNIFNETDIGIIKLGVIIGHDSIEQGAVIGSRFLELKDSITEYEYNSMVAKAMKKYSEDHPEKYIEVLIITRNVVGISGAYAQAIAANCDLVIELHFNSHADESIHGTETLCSPNADDLLFANIVQKRVYSLFIIKDRGVKTLTNGMRGNKSVAALPNIPNCLVEPFFGSNLNDATAGISFLDSYAGTLVSAAVDYANAKNIHLGKFT